MLGSKTDGIGGHTNMLQCHMHGLYVMVTCHDAIGNGLDVMATCWETILMNGDDVTVTSWDGI